MSLILMNMIKELRNDLGRIPLTENFSMTHVTSDEIRHIAYNPYDDNYYGFRGNYLVKARKGSQFSNVWTDPIFNSYSPAGLKFLSNGNILVWAIGGRLKVLDKNFTLLKEHTGIYQPLNNLIGTSEANGIVMTSEYGGPNGIDGSKVWKSTDFGLTWTTVKEFADITHIHSVQYDRYGDCWWVCTGDPSSASQIWQSTNDGATWELKASGTQDYRLCGIGITRDRLIWIPDNPSAKDNNKLWVINREDIDSDWTTNRQELSSSIHGACYGQAETADGRILFFTSAESSPYSALYISDGVKSKMLAKIQKKFGSSVLLAGFTNLTELNYLNSAYVLVREADKFKGVYQLNIPLDSLEF